MRFKVGNPTRSIGEYFCLTPNTGWNDFSFVTTFYLHFCTATTISEIGEVKIGFKKQEIGQRTVKYLPAEFDCLPDDFFSLGQSPEYYQSLDALSNNVKVNVLSSLRDIVYDENIFEESISETVLIDSLTRYVSVSTIKGQFKDIISTGVALKKFGFTLNLDKGSKIDFSVVPNSKPPSNIHVVIGRNGVGKSHLLRTIVNHIDKADGIVTKPNGDDIHAYDFGQLLYFSLSVFDKPFEHVEFNDSKTRRDRTKKKYIGLYNTETQKPKDIDEDLAKEFAESLNGCLLGSEVRKHSWLKVMEHLQLDVNFRELSLSELADLENEHALIKQATALFKTLSSGHAAVLYYLTHVVELVENKTICLFDEPENYLHPPLLSAFIRTLSTLLTDNNGMAIMATHSPVVLQEIPRLCTWKLHHISAGNINVSRPNIETFGESVGEITAEVFSLDLRKTGFYALLEKDSLDSGSVDKVLSMYENQVGLEGRAVIYATIKG